ncbi:unnamed protein product [Caenorhabditis angaria]|uniref:Mediator of RNA polymerase II transcription subunit 17 n=1 Tax=Caenorhabditis angaria TaxID=860376 RepID=A0A9P1IW30_9PELO|nr:unnamed protein product [Caenorhabditis angaria]
MSRCKIFILVSLILKKQNERSAMNPMPGVSFTAPPPPPPIPQGVELVLEASDQWKIQEIGYDGVEKYIKPETFTDNVGKLARKIDWMKIVGSDVPTNSTNELDDENVEKKTKPSEDLVVPEVGPWSFVAKQLHESLQQLNVLLDNLNIAKNTDYMKPLTVLDPISNFETNAEMINIGKGTQWIWKRRAIQEAASVLENAGKQRQRAASSLGLSDEYMSHMQRTQFFEELKEMRDFWRVRKTGDRIYGDLSYNIFGTKYETHTLFDINRRNVGKNETSNESILEVSVPKDLTRRTMLNVSIIKDEVQSGNMYSSGNDEHEIYLKNCGVKEKDKFVHWKDALKWAQNTLFCRDTFNNLCKDAIKLRNRLSVIRDNVLLISLFDDYLLRVELKFYPFEKGELEEEGDKYLNRILRELVVSFECTKFLRPQMFTSSAITHLPESLDMRGSMAYSADEIKIKAIKPKTLLERLLDMAGHYHLVNLTGKIVEKCASQTRDPCLTHRWVQSGRKLSKLTVYMSSKDYEPVLGSMRNAFNVDVTTDCVIVESKEGVKMICHRDPEQIMYSFNYCVCTYSISLISLLAKNMWTTPFHTLHANIHALDDEGKPAPNLILCNQDATQSVLFVFRVGKEPEIRIRKFVVNDATMKPEEHKWRKLNYEKLAGSTLCRKVDVLLAFLRDAP